MIDTLVSSGVARYVPFKLLDSVGLYDEAKAEVKTVPGSKEDVFKSKELGVLQKRKLMKFLMATATQDSNKPEEPQNNDERFLDHLRGKNVGLDKDISNAIFYALALSTDTNGMYFPFCDPTSHWKSINNVYWNVQRKLALHWSDFKSISFRQAGMETRLFWLDILVVPENWHKGSVGRCVPAFMGFFTHESIDHAQFVVERIF
jgi:hypothetical protein